MKTGVHFSSRQKLLKPPSRHHSRERHIDYIDYDEYSDDGDGMASVLNITGEGVHSSYGLSSIWPYRLEGFVFVPRHDAVGLDDRRANGIRGNGCVRGARRQFPG